MNKKKLHFFAGFCVSLAALYLAFMNVHWQELIAAFSVMKLPWFVLGVAYTLLELYLGAWRWRVLLNPLGRYKVFQDCFPLFMIGYAANQILPVRPGEIIRSYWFGQKFNLSKASVLGSAVVEKLLDVVSLLALMSACALFITLPIEVKIAGFAAGIASVIGWMILWYSFRRPGEITSFLRIIRWLPTYLHNRIQNFALNMLSGLATLNRIQDAFYGFAISLAIWIVGILVTHAYLAAFGLHLPWYASVFVLVVVNLGMLIPSSPGAVGVAHLLYVVSLAVFGVDKAVAVAFGLAIHGVSLLVIVFVGFLCLGHEKLELKDIRNE